MRDPVPSGPGEGVQREVAWHSLEAEEAFSRLGSSALGLTAEEARRRLEQHGRNEIPGEGEIDIPEMVLAQLKNPLNAVLAAAAVISFLAGKAVDMAVIAAIIVFNTSMGFIQEYRAEKALQMLKSMTSLEAELLRRSGGEHGGVLETRVKTAEVVPGDVLMLEAGDKVPADARIFEAANLDIDESMLTGESIPVSKTAQPVPASAPVADRKNIAYSGSIVTHGRGKAVVFGTGMQTEMGKIAKLIGETDKAETPIQRRTRDLSKKLGVFALFTSCLTLVIGLLRGFEFMEILLFSLASAVSAIPEGLLVVMTITLAVGAHRMVRRNALIRKLQAVETLGSVTVICTDKTGTLTTNQMTLREVVVGGTRSVSTTGVGYAPEGRFEAEGAPVDISHDEELSLLLKAAALCNDSSLRRHETDEGVKWEINGDPTEGALVVGAEKGGVRVEDLNSALPRVDEIPFDSKRMFMATFHDAGDEGVMVCVKGAPETVLAMCCEMAEGDEARDISEEDVRAATESAKRMASEAMRVLGVAYQMIDRDDVADFKAKLEERVRLLAFLGLVGMIDPPRPEANGAIGLCKAAGIKVLMLTGDHKLTADAIAREIGILDRGGTVVEGRELDGMGDEELDRMVEHARVFARVSPTHKHRIVEALRRRGEVVAMTGDGVNDAPALKAAEVGIAMGITGSDVTKETAEMVLADDNFVSIVNAVEEGRVVFENIRKVTKYLISTNTAEILTIQAALILIPGAPLILTPIMILWINLVTDGLLDKSLALEPKEEDVMDEPPRAPGTKLVDRTMVQNVVILGIFMATGTLFLFSRELDQEGQESARTIAFVTMAMFQVFNALNCRSRTKSIFKVGILTNKYLVVAIAASFALNFLATTVPFMQTALGTVALSFHEWVAVLLVSSSILVVDEVRKAVRPRVERALRKG